MTAPRIALIHATPLAIEPIVNAFRRLWPQARTTNVLEDSLAPDLAADGRLTERMIELLYKSAPLHDIGKIGIPDSILLKPGKLTVEEFEVMKTHTTLGRKAIEDAERRLGMRVAFLSVSKEIAYSHQEKWDGSGYPQGLAGDQIPVSARLMAVADVYDALINKRVYKAAFSHDQACSTIVKGKGTHFDPDMVDAFVDIAEDFRSIALKYPDPE